MKYLVAQDWSNTHGNHAGMVHMCNLLYETYPGEYTVMYKPLSKRSSKKVPYWLKMASKIIRICISWVSLRIWVEKFMPYCKILLDNIKDGDSVYLLQYCAEGTAQDKLAKYLKKRYSNIKIYAMSHLTKSKYIELGFDARRIMEWDRYVDKHILMGSSLTKYFIECGVSPNKISTGFHYVDNYYYFKLENEIIQNKRPTIIAMGALQRDYGLLADIVNNVTSVNWIICKGCKDVDNLFNGKNIKLVGFVSEDELRELMGKSDVSLNVLEDTVGSNVIATSMAMGLAIIGSDVGSIRDYVDESCGILCENTKDSFVSSIEKLVSNPAKIVEMRKESLKRSKTLTIDKVHLWFNSL